MKNVYRFFMGIQIFLYKLTGGLIGGKMMGFSVLLLTTTGRKSGKLHTTPLGYFMRNGGYIVVASNSGGEKNPAWFLNIQNNRNVRIQIRNKTLEGTARTLSGEERAKAWKQVVSSAPQYAAYEKRTTREIPVLLIEVKK